MDNLQVTQLTGDIAEPPVNTAPAEPVQMNGLGDYLKYAWNWFKNGVSSGWNDFKGRLTDYYDQTQVGTNADAALGQGLASGDITWEEGFEQIGEAMSNSGSNTENLQGTSGQTATHADISSVLGNSAVANSEALTGLANLYQQTGNEAYLEKLYDSLLEIENMNSARSWEKMMSDTQFSRLVDDISKAGYNPWIALQSGFGSGASASSLGSAGRSNVSATSQKVSEENNRRSTAAEVTSNVIRAVLFIALLAIKKM